MDRYNKISCYLIIVLLGNYFLGKGVGIPIVGRIQMPWWTQVLGWIVVILYSIYRMPKKHGSYKLRHKGSVMVWAFNCGVVWIGIQLLVGFIVGFGGSPYDHSIKGIFVNVLTIGTGLIGREIIRSYVIHSVEKTRRFKVCILITILMVILQVNMVAMERVKDLESGVVFMAQQMFPIIGENIIATLFVWCGGSGASIIYLGMVEAFEWLTPILPNIDWLLKGALGLAVPLVMVSILLSKHARLTREVKRYASEEKSTWKMIPFLMVSVLYIWFTVGIFPVYPSAIATGSMQPMIDPGDVVLVEKLETIEEIATLQVGDTIQFDREGIYINHRIVAIESLSDDVLIYQTKGDNNSAVDGDWVKMEEIKGKIIGVIPKIGWPTIWLKSEKNETLENIVF